MAINAERALWGNTSGKKHYLSSLTITDNDKAVLRNARDTIRDCLRKGFRDWGDRVRSEELFDNFAVGKVYQNTSLKPKFRMQGSWSYSTLNCTTHEPPQEIDLDDGMFLPVSFLDQSQTAQPVIVSKEYFNLVEDILCGVCEQEGWDLIRNKPSCVRVSLRAGAHIDIALYAIPDDAFNNLVGDSQENIRVLASDQKSDDLVDAIYWQLRSEQILLAHRDEGWKPSDPRKLETWFNEKIKLHGPQLRRVCRYLKGWRDNRWGKSRLSSIALMACTVQVYDESQQQLGKMRDDCALQLVAGRLPAILGERIHNPVVGGQFLDEGWDDAERQKFVVAAKQLLNVLGKALVATELEDARSLLVQEFGRYMPEELSYYSEDTDSVLGGLCENGVSHRAVSLGGDERYG